MKKLVIFILLALTAQAGISLFGSGVKISVTPQTASTPWTERITITAKITGKDAAKGVMWTTSAGMITAIPGETAASFMPPNACGVATIIALAIADPSKTAKALVTVTANAKITIDPASATLKIPKYPNADPVPQTLRFKATGPCPANF